MRLSLWNWCFGSTTHNLWRKSLIVWFGPKTRRQQGKEDQGIVWVSTAIEFRKSLLLNRPSCRTIKTWWDNRHLQAWKVNYLPALVPSPEVAPVMRRAFQLLCTNCKWTELNQTRDTLRRGGFCRNSRYKTLAWPPPQIAVHYSFLLCKVGQWKSLEKCRRDIFKQQERGLKLFGDVSGCFSNPFFVFRTRFGIGCANFGGDFVSADVPP